ncbi:hypothetical protein D3C80_757790 [compost metagenome]
MEIAQRASRREAVGIPEGFRGSPTSVDAVLELKIHHVAAVRPPHRLYELADARYGKLRVFIYCFLPRDVNVIAVVFYRKPADAVQHGMTEIGFVFFIAAAAASQII